MNEHGAMIMVKPTGNTNLSLGREPMKIGVITFIDFSSIAFLPPARVSGGEV